MLTLEEALRTRHSVRNFHNRPLDAAAADALRRQADSLNAAHGLHFQLVTGEPRAFAGLASYGKFSGVESYLVLAARRDKTIEETVGYCGEQLVLLAQRLGLNSCWAGLTYRKVAHAFSLGAGEKIHCLVALGYGLTPGTPHRSRTPQQVSNLTPEAPLWFRRGVEAALLAPTAVNQQKFRFDLLGAGPDGRPLVRASRGFSLAGYTRIDLGIARLHFEIGAGTDHFAWADR